MLQRIGCPHASKKSWIEIDYPAVLKKREGKEIKVPVKGCSFCDVARDKGFFGELDMDTIISQINCLPEDEDNRKIPFELINENPLFNLPILLKEASERKIKISQSFG